MPPHSTHRLQPLDVGLFSLLSTAYTKQLNHHMFNSMGRVSITKRLFYPMFRAAFAESFTEKNIESAFEKTGIWLFNPEKVLSKIRKPEPVPKLIEPSRLNTPTTSRTIRRIHQVYQQSRQDSILSLIFRANI